MEELDAFDFIVRSYVNVKGGTILGELKCVRIMHMYCRTRRGFDLGRCTVEYSSFFTAFNQLLTVYQWRLLTNTSKIAYITYTT